MLCIYTVNKIHLNHYLLMGITCSHCQTKFLKLQQCKDEGDMADTSA